jgi:hypothetical protein
MRIHARAGARLVGVCGRSARIPGMVLDWEKWTGMRMPDSGRYVVPGGLAPIKVDHDAGVALYVEPNVWMVHSLSEETR